MGRLVARKGGSSWVDVNTAGCLGMDLRLNNDSSILWIGSDTAAPSADGTVAVTVLRGSTRLTSAMMTRHERRAVLRHVDFRQTSRVRILVQDRRSYEGLEVESDVWLLCNNPGTPGPAAKITTPLGTGGFYDILSDPSTDYYGTTVRIGGWLAHEYLPNGVKIPVGGETMRVLRSRHGADRWAQVATLRTSAGGWFSYTATRGYPYDYAFVSPDRPHRTFHSS